MMLPSIGKVSIRNLIHAPDKTNILAYSGAIGVHVANYSPQEALKDLVSIFEKKMGLSLNDPELFFVSAFLQQVVSENSKKLFKNNFRNLSIDVDLHFEHTKKILNPFEPSDRKLILKRIYTNVYFAFMTSELPKTRDVRHTQRALSILTKEMRGVLKHESLLTETTVTAMKTILNQNKFNHELCKNILKQAKGKKGLIRDLEKYSRLSRTSLILKNIILKSPSFQMKDISKKGLFERGSRKANANKYIVNSAYLLGNVIKEKNLRRKIQI